MEKSFGNILRSLRLEKKWTQSQLAERLNIKQRQVSQLELDVIEPNLEMIRKVSILFGETADFLLGLED